LLTGISRAGKDSGLEFELFEPKPERKKDFYAEIPVEIKVVGDYHGVATFFESVAGLNRIVNIRDVDMAPDKSSQKLVTSCSAVTYKFIEETKQPEKKRKKSKRKKK
jgi:type IV pilus assembly protein PilO